MTEPSWFVVPCARTWSGRTTTSAPLLKLAHQVGALVVADGVSYAPHVIPDVHKLGVDFYGYSTYKTFGTHQGVLWGSRGALQEVKAQGHFFNQSESRYRLNPTGPQHAEIAALAGITEYFDALYRHHFGESSEDRHDRAHKVFTLVAEHEATLANRLLGYLKERPDLRIIRAGSCRTRWTRLYGRVLRRRYLLGKDRARTCGAGHWSGQREFLCTSMY